MMQPHGTLEGGFIDSMTMVNRNMKYGSLNKVRVTIYGTLAARSKDVKVVPSRRKLMLDLVWMSLG